MYRPLGFPVCTVLIGHMFGLSGLDDDAKLSKPTKTHESSTGPLAGTVLVNTGTQLHPGLGHWMPGNPGGRDNINTRYLELVHMIIIAPPLCTDL